jgi:hypothetical protein
MFMAINGQFIEGYLMRYRRVYSVIFHLQPVLSRIPLDDKSILSNSVRKPINIQLKMKSLQTRGTGTELRLEQCKRTDINQYVTSQA